MMFLLEDHNVALTDVLDAHNKNEALANLYTAL